MVDEKILRMLMQQGIKYVPRINDVLLEADDLRALEDKPLAVAVIMYAASLASMTKLNAEDFLALSLYAYSNISVEKPTDERSEPALPGPVESK